jgi:hypothetical protein
LPLELAIEPDDRSLWPARLLELDDAMDPALPDSLAFSNRNTVGPEPWIKQPVRD